MPLSAVVADGAGASTTGDRALVETGALAPVAASTSWVTNRLVEDLTGAREPVPLKDVVGRSRAPVLLIASDRAGERRFDAALRRRIGSRAALWSVDDVGHTRALERHPRAYARRVLGFMRAAVGGTRPAA